MTTAHSEPTGHSGTIEAQDGATLRPTGRLAAQLQAGGRLAGERSHRESSWDSQHLAAPDPSMIVIRDAHQHNLRHINLTIPRNKLVVLTGVSGSGKSTLAFDTIFAEGQRRYVESLSAYARKYIEQLERPKVDYIAGLSPTIAIEQRSISKNPRSTVGTITEITSYLRLLFSRIGIVHCDRCRYPIEPRSASEVAARLAELPPGSRLELLAPLERPRGRSSGALLAQARRAGVTHARVNGVLVALADAGQLRAALQRSEDVPELLAAVVEIGQCTDVQQLAQQIRETMQAGGGRLAIRLDDEQIYSSDQHRCPRCGTPAARPLAAHFSPNSPHGMCPDCHGLGTRLEVDPELIVDQPHLSLLSGASRWFGDARKKPGTVRLGHLEDLAAHYGVDLELPWSVLPQRFRDVLLYGSGEEKIRFAARGESDDTSWSSESTRPFKGLVYHINRLFRETKSEWSQERYTSFMRQMPCSVCHGTRLAPVARRVTIGGKTIGEVGGMAIEQLGAWLSELEATLSAEQFAIGDEILREVRNRIQFMLNVGLGYLSLDRSAPTLSGGEGQRIRLASQIGSGLVGVMYVLDEPSVGLHQRDLRTLLSSLLYLRDMGNTVLVVEHDAETMRAADWIIDMGPGAGINGGLVVSAGALDTIMTDPRSLTGRYLSGELSVGMPEDTPRRRAPERWLSLAGARLHNLRSVTAHFPIGLFTCVTGVSGSGKSSLVSGTLLPILQRELHRAKTTPGPYQTIEGIAHLDKVIPITQEPIGRTPRSNPATYVGIFDQIRHLFAELPESRARGFGPQHFSFNAKGGRCEACQGHGQIRIEMLFLSDVWLTCKECQGRRFGEEILGVCYRGKHINDVLDMDVQEALTFFADQPKIARVLQTLHDVGLDYLKLGQSATTLSGGEAQRIKLASELSRASTGQTIYILDEPTTGLHFADIQRLLDVLHRLIDANNTVVVIEHNLDVIKSADWIIDMGPGGGVAGGAIIAEGSPAEIARSATSVTGHYLRTYVPHL